MTTTVKILNFIFAYLIVFYAKTTLAFKNSRGPAILQLRTETHRCLDIIEAEIVKDIDLIKSDIIRKAGLAVRGELATESEKTAISTLVEELESSISTSATSSADTLSKCLGYWELIYSSTYLFRSSPFFMAARAVCAEGEEADRFNFFCQLHREALAFTSIGHVRQRVTENELISEFESNVAAVPGLPIIIKVVVLHFIRCKYFFKKIK